MTDNRDVVLDAPEDSGAHGDRVISRGTWVAGIIMALVLLVGVTLDYLSWSGILAVNRDIVLGGLILLPLAASAWIIPIALSFAKGGIRTQWTLLGLGMLSIGLGAAIFVVLYLVTGKDPYPSVGDVFTLGGYAFFAAVLYLAIRGYRNVFDVRVPLFISAGVGVVALAVVYFTVLGPYVLFAPAETQPPMTRFFNTIYPVLDVLVLLVPAIGLGLVVSKLGSGRVAWPWWLVVGGASALAVTDAVFAYSGYVGAGRTPVVDAGYGLAPLLIGLAVLVARDVYRS